MIYSGVQRPVNAGQVVSHFRRCYSHSNNDNPPKVSTSTTDCISFLTSPVGSADVPCCNPSIGGVNEEIIPCARQEGTCFGHRNRLGCSRNHSLGGRVAGLESA